MMNGYYQYNDDSRLALGLPDFLDDDPVMQHELTPAEFCSPARWMSFMNLTMAELKEAEEARMYLAHLRNIGEERHERLQNFWAGEANGAERAGRFAAARARSSVELAMDRRVRRTQHLVGEYGKEPTPAVPQRRPTTRRPSTPHDATFGTKGTTVMKASSQASQVASGNLDASRSIQKTEFSTARDSNFTSFDVHRAMTPNGQLLEARAAELADMLQCNVAENRRLRARCVELEQNLLKANAHSAAHSDDKKPVVPVEHRMAAANVVTRDGDRNRSPLRNNSRKTSEGRLPTARAVRHGSPSPRNGKVDIGRGKAAARMPERGASSSNQGPIHMRGSNVTHGPARGAGSSNHGPTQVRGTRSTERGYYSVESGASSSNHRHVDMRGRFHGPASVDTRGRTNSPERQYYSPGRVASGAPTHWPVDRPTVEADTVAISNDTVEVDTVADKILNEPGLSCASTAASSEGNGKFNSAPVSGSPVLLVEQLDPCALMDEVLADDVLGPASTPIRGVLSIAARLNHAKTISSACSIDPEPIIETPEQRQPTHSARTESPRPRIRTRSQSGPRPPWRPSNQRHELFTEFRRDAARARAMSRGSSASRSPIRSQETTMVRGPSPRRSATPSQTKLRWPY